VHAVLDVLRLGDLDEEEVQRSVGGDEGRLIILGKIGIAGILFPAGHPGPPAGELGRVSAVEGNVAEAQWHVGMIRAALAMTRRRGISGPHPSD
jgi:hypothetical protein